MNRAARDARDLARHREERLRREAAERARMVGATIGFYMQTERPIFHYMALRLLDRDWEQADATYKKQIQEMRREIARVKGGRK